ncbi:MAG: hypothetical protein WCJ33_08355, partial [Pseudomonadota bacterium]
FIFSFAILTSSVAFGRDYLSKETESYGLGVEGFRDVYKEPIFSLTDTTNYGAITADYTNYLGSPNKKQLFLGLDGRASYGTDHYESTSGTLSGAAQYEFDARLVGGIRFNNEGFESFSPYTGLGVRYFRDEGKGTVTDLGYYGYDRRITQFYLPLGVAYSYINEDGWSFTPVIEGDVLLGGNVETRLQTFGLGNLENKQKFGSGYGLRAEFMVGWKDADGGVTWKVGPFVRYWDIKDSESNCTIGVCGLEPKNTRLQYGAALRMSW